MDGLAHSAGQGGSSGASLGREGHELRPRLRADAAGEVQLQQCADDVLGTAHSVLVEDPGRVERSGGPGSSGLSVGAASR